MIAFEKVNVNPKGRKTGDCSTRALVSTLGISYNEALKLQMEESLKCYYDPTSKQVIERVLAQFGYIKMKQPRKADNSKYTVSEIDEVVQSDYPILVTVANHHTCVRDNTLIDSWDCRRKSIGNYYMKKGE